MTRRVPPPPMGDDNPATPPPASEQERRKLADANRDDVVPGSGVPVEPANVGEVQAGQDSGPLAHVLASTGSSEQQFAAALMGLRRKKVDPMNDYVLPVTRVLAWVQDAARAQAALTDRTQQEVMRDVHLGLAPILPALLDAAYQDRYGRPRHE